jgi:murein L,D-transpeptidase YafK
VSQAFDNTEDSLKAFVKKAGLSWPVKELYFRNFKYDAEFEVWGRNDDKDGFTLIKTYKVCSMAGTLGPKRFEGDYQVPEGFYYINKFNPRSAFHLSLGINYPNASDDVLSDSLHPGGSIFIHGRCLTVGCIPLQDAPVEEVYTMSVMAKDMGQDFIPVHIFPFRFNNEKGREYFNNLIATKSNLAGFSASLQVVYDYFEKQRRIPLLSVNDKGDYVVIE